jgi:hypothetical protein
VEARGRCRELYYGAVFFLQRRTSNINQLRGILTDLLIPCNKEDGGCSRTGSQMITIGKKIKNHFGNGRRLQHKPCFHHGEDAVLFFNYVALSDTFGILLFRCYVILLSI